MEPSAFAAQLIARLEKLKRERDAMSSLEERLQQIQEVRVHVRSSHVGRFLPLCPLLLGALKLWTLGFQAHLKLLPTLSCSPAACLQRASVPVSLWSAGTLCIIDDAPPKPVSGDNSQAKRQLSPS